MDSRKVFRSLLKDGYDRMKVSSSISFGDSLKKRLSLVLCGLCGGQVLWQGSIDKFCFALF